MVKRILPLALAIMVAIPLSVPAFAADNTDPEAEATTSSGSSVTITDNSENGMVLTADGVQSGITAGPSRLYYPSEIRTVMDGEEELLVKTFQVPAGVNPNILIEEDIERHDIPYDVREILKTTLPGTAEARTVSKTVTAQSDTSDRAAILSELDPVIEYNEDGYSGQLLLSADNISTEASGYSSYQYAITDTKEFSGMDRNDTYYIPKTTTKNGVQLSLLNVDWTPMGAGSVNGGLAYNNFRATAQYSGTATGSTPTGYTVTATYMGEVQRVVDGDVIFAIVYGPRKGFELPEVVDITNIADSGGAIPYVILASVILLGGICTGIILFVKKKGPIAAADGIVDDFDYDDAEDEPEPEAPRRQRIYMPKPDGKE